MPNDNKQNDNDGMLAAIGVAVAGLLAWAFLSGDGPNSPQEAITQTVEQTADTVGLGDGDPTQETGSDNESTLSAATDAVQSFADTQLGSLDENVGGFIGGAADSIGVGEDVDSLVAGFDKTAPEAVASVSPGTAAAATAVDMGKDVAEGIGTQEGRVENDVGGSRTQSDAEKEASRKATNSFEDAGALSSSAPDPDPEPAPEPADELSDRAQNSNLSESNKAAFRGLLK